MLATSERSETLRLQHGRHLLSHKHGGNLHIAEMRFFLDLD